MVLDLTSPKAAARSLVQAVEAQDGRAIVKVFYAADDEERELAQTFADLIVSARKLSDAARAEYGGAGSGLAAGFLSGAELANLDRAEIKQAGDVATLSFLGQSRPMRFHRTADHWQLIVRDFANSEDDLPRQVRLLKQVSGVFDEVSTNIAAEKYANPQDAESAIQTKLAVVMIKAATPATQPTTKPTTAP